MKYYAEDFNKGIREKFIKKDDEDELIIQKGKQEIRKKVKILGYYDLKTTDKIRLAFTRRKKPEERSLEAITMMLNDITEYNIMNPETKIGGRVVYYDFEGKQFYRSAPVYSVSKE